VEVNVSVFLEEKKPCVYERIEVSTPHDRDLDLTLDLTVDINRPACPQRQIETLVATFLPRLPVFSEYWGWGMGRWLQTPAPQRMNKSGPASLAAIGPVAWELAASQPFDGCIIYKKKALLHFDLHLTAGQSACLDLALV